MVRAYPRIIEKSNVPAGPKERPGGNKRPTV
jgi:hypothetical protein